jgi:hypothetical protein
MDWLKTSLTPYRRNSVDADGVIGLLWTRAPSCRLTLRVLVKCTAMDSQEEASSHDLQSFHAHKQFIPILIGLQGLQQRNL